jgi:hypothetical protein
MYHVTCVIAVNFEEIVHIFHYVLSEHVHNDFASLLYAWVSVCSLGSPYCPGITPVALGFSDCC